MTGVCLFFEVTVRRRQLVIGNSVPEQVWMQSQAGHCDVHHAAAQSTVSR